MKKPNKNIHLHTKKPTVAKLSKAQKEKIRRRKKFLAISAIGLLTLVIVGFFYYLFAVLPNRVTILTVAKENVRIDYFVKRVVLNSSGDITSTIQGLVGEMIIKQLAPSMGVTPVTQQDIDNYISDAAKGNDTSITSAELSKWLKEKLNTTGFSNKEFRDLVARNIETQRLTDILSKNIQTIQPQVHLFSILVNTQDTAIKAKARIDGGEDFSAVAKAVSLESTVATTGGDLGWLPPAVLGSQLSPTVQSLEIGKCSDPIPYVQQGTSSSSSTTSYILFLVTEKADTKEISADQLAQLKNQQLNAWLSSQAPTVSVTFHGLNGSNTLDSKTSAWITYKVEEFKNKLASRSLIISTTAEVETSTTETNTGSAGTTISPATSSTSP